jgi:hypothetical protein
VLVKACFPNNCKKKKKKKQKQKSEKTKIHQLITLSPLKQFLQPLVLLSDVVLGGHVTQDNGGLGRQQLQRIDKRNF